MNTPPEPATNPALWALRQDHAASLLPGNFADNVLRAIRLARAPARDTGAPLALRLLRNPFALSALTATACLAAAIIFHTQANTQANEQNLADWRAIIAQTANLEPL